MHSPLSRLPSHLRRPALAALLALTLGLFAALTVQGRPLITPAAPLGILSYEFAGDKARADAILKSWSSHADTARLQLWLDFPFLIVYPLLLSLACSMTAEAAPGSGSHAGVLIAWVVLAAGPLDAAENILLLRMLDQGPGDATALAAAACAAVKFLLVFTAGGFIALQWTRHFLKIFYDRI